MKFAVLLLLAGAGSVRAADGQRLIGSVTWPVTWEEARREASAAYGRADYAATREALMAALDMAKTFRAEDMRYSITLGELGGLCSEQGNLREAERYYLQAISRWPKIAEGDPHRSSLLAGLGSVYFQTQEFSKAERYGLAALAASEQSYGRDHRELVVPLNNLALVYSEQGRFAEAREALGRAVNVLELAGRANDPVAAPVHNSLGMVYAYQGEPQAAVSEISRAVSIWERAASSDHPRVAMALSNLAAMYCRLRRWQEAEQPVRRAREIITDHLGPEHPALNPALRTYASVLRHTGRKREARRLEETADRIREQSRTGNAIGYTLDASTFRR
jgi:tetratricopeptide (TPR) repeat protein